MKSMVSLPEGYREILHIDLQNDKKMMLKVNILACIVMVVMLVAGFAFVPGETLFSNEDLGAMWLKLGALGAGYLLYIFAHEGVHGIAMILCCDAKPYFGFTGMYAYAASKAYYCRKDYIVIALAPIVSLGILLAILNFLIPISWFHVVYFIQAGNISGAAGDLYVTWLLRRLPSDILIQDDGVAMRVYAAGE